MPRMQPRKVDKSPLHDSALRIGDVHIGRSFIVFNIYSGSRTRGHFRSLPFIGTTGLLQVQVSGAWAHEGLMFLSDMGIVPRMYVAGCPYWNEANVTIDARKEHLLPESLGDESYPYRFDDFEEDDGFYDAWNDGPYMGMRRYYA